MSFCGSFLATQSALYVNAQLSSLALYKTLQPEYEYAQYILSVICFSNRRLISCCRFRCGCHGLHVDTGRFDSQKLPREDRACHVCRSSYVEDEHHSLFDCPEYAHIRDTFAALSQGCPHTVAFFINSNNLTVVGRYLRSCFSHTIREFVLDANNF